MQMSEQSKAARRRYYDGAFHNGYFVGCGIDIGGKPDLVTLSLHRTGLAGIRFATLR